MPRPGRPPSDPRKLDVKLWLDTEEDGWRVRDAGGGNLVRQLVQEWLDRTPQRRATTQVIPKDDEVEIRVNVPREQLDPPAQ